MSSGYGVNEVLALIQLSWNAVESATTASSKHDDLTREVSTVHDILAHVYTELSVPDASISRARSNSKAELQRYLAGCGTQLGIIHTVLVKFNALDADQKSGKQLWSKIRFANGKYQDLTEIRSRMATYSTAITMILRLISLGSRGKIERELSHQKGSLKGIRESVNLALAHINSTTRQKSLLIAYSNDSKAFWSRLRRELTNQGFSRFALNKKKDLILSYMKELDSRGVLGYSTSFGRAFQARNETNRQSHTPESFQSSSISAHCRNSNSSFQSIRYGKDSGYDSSTYDEPTCIISDPCNLPWTYSRPVNAVEHEQNTNFVLKDIKGGCKHRYNKSPSPSIPFRIRAEPDFTFPLETTNGLVDMPTQPCSMHSPFHESPRMRRRRSAKEIEQYIRFEDPYGREFSFPLSEAKSWEGVESLMKRNCSSTISAFIGSHNDGINILPYLWEEVAEPGTKITIRRPSTRPSQHSEPCLLTNEFKILLEQPRIPEEDFSHLPTLGDWVQRGITEFTPHSEFYDMD